MIVNDTQLAVTLGWIDEFRRAARELDKGQAGGVHVHTLIRKAQRDGITSMLAELEAEVSAYNKLKTENSGER